ncbi:MAG: mechanosensitive ion channel [Desulfobacterales bacterium]
MNGWQAFFQRFIIVFDLTAIRNRPGSLLAALAIIAAGFFILEIVFRTVRRRIQSFLEKNGRDPGIWDVSAVLPAARLAASAGLLRLAESVIATSEKLNRLLHAVEGLLLALAVITAVFWLVGRLDYLRRLLPGELQHRYPEDAMARVKRLLRLLTLVGTAAFYLNSQKSLLPEGMWQHSVWRYLLIVLVVLLVYLAIRQIGALLTNMAIVLRASKENVRLRLVLEAAIWPVRLLLFSVAIYATKEILVFPTLAQQAAEILVNVLGTLAVILFVYHLIELMVFELTKYAARDDNLLDQSFVHMMRMIAKAVVVIAGIIYLLRAVSGKSLSALLAGLGIGGIAVALAAQDTLKNFFGSLMIMLDKPFVVGQRITSGGFDGVIENIGFRSTRMRTLTGHLVTIPNEKVASESVENIGQRPSIRRLANITITYDTPPDKVERAVHIIREILDNHEGMHPDFPPRVFFNEFNDASLNIIMLYWFHPADYWLYMAFTERVNLQIMRSFEAEGIEFAFPTTTNYLAHDRRRPLHISISDDRRKVEPDVGRQLS